MTETWEPFNYRMLMQAACPRNWASGLVDNSPLSRKTVKEAITLKILRRQRLRSATPYLQLLKSAAQRLALSKSVFSRLSFIAQDKPGGLPVNRLKNLVKKEGGDCSVG